MGAFGLVSALAVAGRVWADFRLAASLEQPPAAAPGQPTVEVRPASFTGRAFSALVLPRLVRKDPTQSADAFEASILRRRAAGPALPDEAFRSRWRVTEAQVEGRRIISVAPRTGSETGVILYLPGGAYVHDPIAPHWTIVERLAEATGRRVVVVFYPLAPESDHRAGLAMVEAVWRNLSADMPGRRITIAGDSAGGGLALALAQRLRDSGAPPPEALVLICPWLDVTLSDPEQRAIEPRDPMLTLSHLRRAGELWGGPAGPAAPQASPLFGGLAGLPPTLVFAAGNDLLRPDAVRFSKAASGAGVEVVLSDHPGMFHVFPGAPIPDADRAFARIAAFLR